MSSPEENATPLDWSKLVSPEATAQRSGIISSYVDSLAPQEKARSILHAKEIEAQGGELPSFVVLTPVAAHQEQPETILHAIAEYAVQKQAGPFTVILGLNYPKSEQDNPLVEQNRLAVELAKELYPDLDLRFIEQSYAKPTKIGRIRRDIWNSAVVLSDMQNYESGYRETIGLNQDIDLVTLSPHFIQSAKQHFRFEMSRLISVNDVMDLWGRGRLDPIYSNAKHAYDPRYPNVSHAVFWQEFARKQHTGNLFEAGALIPFVHYAKNGGISPTAPINEVNSLIDKGNHLFDVHRKISYTALKTVHSETNIRRYAERLHDNDFDDVWTQDSFSQHDTYRNHDAPLTDISHERLEHLVIFHWEHTKELILSKSYKTIQSGPYSDDGVEKIQKLVDRQLFTAARLLDRVVGLPDFAKTVDAERGYLPRILSHAYAKELERRKLESAARAYARARGAEFIARLERQETAAEPQEPSASHPDSDSAQ